MGGEGFGCATEARSDSKGMGIESCRLAEFPMPIRCDKPRSGHEGETSAVGCLPGIAPDVTLHHSVAIKHLLLIFKRAQ